MDTIEDLKQNEKMGRFVHNNKGGSRTRKPRQISFPPKRRVDNVNVLKEEKESERRDPPKISRSRTQYLNVSSTPKRHLHGGESHWQSVTTWESLPIIDVATNPPTRKQERFPVANVILVGFIWLKKCREIILNRQISNPYYHSTKPQGWSQSRIWTIKENTN